MFEVIPGTSIGGKNWVRTAGTMRLVCLILRRRKAGLTEKMTIVGAMDRSRFVPGTKCPGARSMKRLSRPEAKRATP